MSAPADLQVREGASLFPGAPPADPGGADPAVADGSRNVRDGWLAGVERRTL
jgi:hypothetical protein